MGLLQELQARERGGRGCAFGKWLQTATPEDYQDLEIALADSTIATRWITEALQVRGLPGNETHLSEVIGKHRRGACQSCPPGALNVAP